MGNCLPCLLSRMPKSLDSMTESKENDVIEQRSYLSDDLIIHEILTRLPVKSIIRFKSVSKQWYCTLSSSKFASFNLAKSPFSHPCAPVNTLFIMSDKDCYLFSYDDDQISGNLEDNLDKLDIDFGEKDYLILAGCCNGLVCLSKPFGEYFCLWNPATRKLHKYESGWGSEQISNIAHIFSFWENKWRKIDFNHDVVFPYGKPMLLNEKIYWVGYSVQITPVIVCFDFVLEKFDVIKLNLVRFSYLGVMGAPLSESKYDSTNPGIDLIIQILGSTIIDRSIDLPKEMILDMDSQVIGYTRTGGFFATGKSNDGVEVKRAESRMLWLVDSVMKPMQCKTLLKFNNAPLNFISYVPSLLSPIPIEELSEA
ncbi:putative F-box/kelch-repeat protein At1g13200 [Silene latifolia]|uniref:putative F-box/kelch-repeat protein At1g13200 n=1 Tax=Silene latifolia TaxID=37657 RepID=UPI003D770134